MVVHGDYLLAKLLGCRLGFERVGRGAGPPCLGFMMGINIYLYTRMAHECLGKAGGKKKMRLKIEKDDIEEMMRLKEKMQYPFSRLDF